MKVEIYSDVACPWCYIGERRFARALDGFAGKDDVEVVFRPYQLDPGAAPTPRPLLEALRAKFGAGAAAMAERVTTVAAGEGIAMRFDRAVAANTFGAHRLLRHALETGGPAVQRALAERLFDAHFARGEDVGDPAVLATCAADAGMDRDAVARWLATDAGVAATRYELAASRALGVTAVPTFVFDGKYAVEGGQPSETFAQVLDEVARRAGEATVPDEGESCADGSCEV